MRKVTAAQIAAMAASVSFVTHPAIRFGIPLFGLAISAHSDTYDDNELEEVVVTGSRPSGPAWDVYVVPSGGGGTSSGGGGGGGGSSATPVAVSPTNADTSMKRNATRCATQYSIQANVNPNGGGGEAPTYQTLFVSGYAWGTSDVNSPAQPVITSTNAPPGPGYVRVLGWTSTVQRASYIYTTNVQYDASQLGIDFQAYLVNTVAHEWAHQWNPFYPDDSEPNRLGNLTQQLYEQAGGASATCNTRPVRYREGSFGGRK